mgnify:FL=1
MDKNDFNNIMEGLKEMVAIERGEVAPPPERVHVFHVPDTKSIRKKTGLSQSQFSKRFGITFQTLQSWESGRRNPIGPSSILLKVIAKNPNAVAEVVSEEDVLGM